MQFKCITFLLGSSYLFTYLFIYIFIYWFILNFDNLYWIFHAAEFNIVPHNWWKSKSVQIQCGPT